MKHNWKPYSEHAFGSPGHRMEQLAGDVGRKCAACGAVQRREGTGSWMRIGKRRWLPLAGRCPGTRAARTKKGGGAP